MSRLGKAVNTPQQYWGPFITVSRSISSYSADTVDLRVDEGLKDECYKRWRSATGFCSPPKTRRGFGGVPWLSYCISSHFTEWVKEHTRRRDCTGIITQTCIGSTFGLFGIG